MVLLGILVLAVSATLGWLVWLERQEELAIDAHTREDQCLSAKCELG